MGFKLVCSCSGCERELNMLGVTASTVPSDGPKPVSKPKRAHRRRLSITIANEDGVITNTIDEKVDDGKHTLQQQSPTLTTKRASIQ